MHIVRYRFDNVADDGCLFRGGQDKIGNKRSPRPNALNVPLGFWIWLSDADNQVHRAGATGSYGAPYGPTLTRAIVPV